MAVYNLGDISTHPFKELNAYTDQLLDYKMKSNLQKQELQGKKEIANIDKATQLQIAAAKATKEQEDKSRTYLDALVQKGVDKFGNDEFARLSETDKGYSDLYKKYVELHPEFKGIDNIKATLPQSTKDQIKEQVDNGINTVKAKMLKSGPESLSEGERSIMQMEGYKDEFSEVVSAAIRNPEFQYMKPEEQQKMIQDGLKLLRSRSESPLKINEFTDILSGGQKPMFYGPMAQFSGANTQKTETSTSTTPTRFKVKRVK